MTYTDIHEPGYEPPIYSDGTVHTIEYTVARSDHQCKSLDLVVVLECTDSEEWAFELSFSLLVVPDSEESGAVLEIQSGLMARNYLPAEMRPLVLQLVMESSRRFVRELKPASISRVTKEHQLPEKALAKHHMLSRTLVECGYRVHAEGNDQFGRRFCHMRLDD